MRVPEARGFGFGGYRSKKEPSSQISVSSSGPPSASGCGFSRQSLGFGSLIIYILYWVIHHSYITQHL